MPVTVTERLLPDAALAGLRDVMVGTGFGTAIVKGRALEGPPPGGGVETVTWAVPGLAKAEGLIVALNVPTLWTDVCWGTPLKFRTAEEAKFDPVTNTELGAG